MAARTEDWSPVTDVGYVSIGGELGGGVYGAVRPFSRGGELFAIKGEKVFGAGLPVEHSKRIYREIVIQRYLCSPLSGHAHPNIVMLKDVRARAPLPPHADAFVFLAMNNAGRSLGSIISGRWVEMVKKDPPLHHQLIAPLLTFSLAEVRDITWQLLLALAYLHEAKFCHRDLKPDNVMLEKVAPEMGGSRVWRLQICDMGLARSMRVEGTVAGGDPAAAAPAQSTTCVCASSPEKPARRPPNVLPTRARNFFH